MAVTNGRVADAAHDCIASFDAIAQIFLPEAESSTTASGWSQNEDGRSRFQIWMSNLGAAHPVTDRRSADYRLREAPEVVDRIVELLEELTEINGEVREIVSGERSNRHVAEEHSDTDSLSPSSGQDELSELFLSIGDVLTSLFRVSMLVKKATTRDRYGRAASAKDKPYLVEFDIRHVADKFPKAREQPWLLERLGTAITQRRQFLRYCRNHKNRIAHVSDSFLFSSSVVLLCCYHRPQGLDSASKPVRYLHFEIAPVRLTASRTGFILRHCRTGPERGRSEAFVRRSPARTSSTQHTWSVKHQNPNDEANSESNGSIDPTA
jgi:hypothetical protein